LIQKYVQENLHFCKRHKPVILSQVMQKIREYETVLRSEDESFSRLIIVIGSTYYDTVLERIKAKAKVFGHYGRQIVNL